MSNINARTLPIALVLGGALIISAVISAYAFGQHVDSFLTAIISVAFVLGLISILLGAGLYYWERSRYYEHIL